MKYTDNYNQTMQEIAQYLLSNGPHFLLKDHSRQTLKEIVEGTVRYYMFSVYYALPNAEVQIDLSHDSESKKDSEGNFWQVYDAPLVQVSWPTYGNNQADIAFVRAKLILEVATFAKELQGFLSQKKDFAKLLETKEEAQERDRLRDARLFLRKLENIVQSLDRKHMRVGHLRFFANAENLSDGQYPDILVDGRKYSITINGDRSILARTE